MNTLNALNACFRIFGGALAISVAFTNLGCNAMATESETGGAGGSNDGCTKGDEKDCHSCPGAAVGYMTCGQDKTWSACNCPGDTGGSGGSEGGSGGAGGDTSTGTTSTPTETSVPMELYFHWKPGTTQDDPVWMQGWGTVSGNLISCQMNLESAQGPNEEFACPMNVWTGEKITFWVFTTNGAAVFYAFDMCDEVGGFCQGKGDWCDADHMVGSVWVTKDTLYGPVQDFDLMYNGAKDQKDVEHLCWQNGEFVVGQ